MGEILKTIQLTQGKVALVDDIDYEHVASFKWYARRAQHGVWHALRNITNPDGTRHTVMMHRFIIGLSADDLHLDHRDCDGLNNQRINLRFADKSGNASNTRVRRDSGSGLKGVHFDKRCGKWSARIKSKGRYIWLGYFLTAEKAARAYDAAAIKYHGEFARPNFEMRI